MTKAAFDRGCVETWHSEGGGTLSTATFADSLFGPARPSSSRCSRLAAVASGSACAHPALERAENVLHSTASDGHGVLHAIQATLRGFEDSFVLSTRDSPMRA